MPDKRLHRGPHPQDEQLFAPEWHPALRAAIADMQWLFERAYTDKAVLKLVGDRYRLRERQRRALARSCCTPAQAADRHSRCLTIAEVPATGLWVDGFNLLILLESALAGGFIFRGLDGCLRDLASVHGNYRQVEETEAALLLIARALPTLPLYWLFDRPVSNSGRLKTLIYDLASSRHLNWQADLADNVDHELLNQSVFPVVSTDRLILDRAEQWCNLGSYLVDTYIPQARIVELPLP